MESDWSSSVLSHLRLSVSLSSLWNAFSQSLPADFDPEPGLSSDELTLVELSAFDCSTSLGRTKRHGSDKFFF